MLTSWASIGAPSIEGAAADAAAANALYIVAVRDRAPAEAAAEAAAVLGAKVEYIYEHALRGFAARMSPAAASSLAGRHDVVAVTPDAPLHATAQMLTTSVNRVEADLSPTAQINGVDDRVNVDVAVLDTGIDLDHPELNVVGGVNCSSSGSRSASKADYDDLDGHGTFVSGIIGAIDNEAGMVGVAPGARLWAVKVLNDNGVGSSASVICGVDWVTARAETIEVANMSLGALADDKKGCNDNGLHEAICTSVARGVTYTVAAGNGGNDAKYFVPASYDEVITVSAMSDVDGYPFGLADYDPDCRVADDRWWPGTNYGADIDLAAPGVCVWSIWRDGGFYKASGTSVAAPHVAGAAGLLQSKTRRSPAEVRAELIERGEKFWNLTPGDPDGIQEPLVNVAAV